MEVMVEGETSLITLTIGILGYVSQNNLIIKASSGEIQT